MASFRERSGVKSVAVMALSDVGLMGVSFSYRPLLSGAAGIIGCLIAIPATRYLLYDRWMGVIP